MHHGAGEARANVSASGTNGATVTWTAGSTSDPVEYMITAGGTSRCDHVTIAFGVVCFRCGAARAAPGSKRHLVAK